MNVPLQFCRIEKCSSPIGDGNLCGKSFVEFREKIEKCSSPIGDGNWQGGIVQISEKGLRNVAPR